jgi:hypothetical protein
VTTSTKMLNSIPTVWQQEAKQAIICDMGGILQ